MCVGSEHYFRMCWYLVERSVYCTGFDEHIFDLKLVNGNTGLRQHTGRDCLEFRDFGLWASDVNFSDIFRILAELSEHGHDTSQLAAGDMCGNTAASAWPSGS